MTETNATPPVPSAPEAPVAPTPQNQASAAAQVPPAAAPQAAQVPPMGAVPPNPAGQVPPQPAYQQPAPQNIPGMPLLTLTGGMKFGWAACGFFMGPIAILLAWLTNAHNFPEAKSAAVKFSLFGFLAQFVIAFLVMIMFGMAACAAIGSAASSGAYYY